MRAAKKIPTHITTTMPLSLTDTLTGGRWWVKVEPHERGERSYALRLQTDLHGPDRRRRYYLKDHLGSTRAVIDKHGEVLETHDYYPFGAQMPGRQFTAGTPTREGFTSKERDTQTGLDYFGARYYHPAYGRWNGVDPLADDPAQIDLSPYAYSWNNPTNVTDPDGRCPSCLFGALAGAGIDFGVQVAVNLAEGKDLGSALTGIDGTSILVSAGAGGVSGGLSVISKANKASKLVKLAGSETGEVVFDAGASSAGQFVDDGEVSATGVAADVIIGKLLGDKVEKVVKRKFLNSKKGKILLREADRTKRVAAQNSRPGKQLQAQQAKTNLDKEVAKRTTSASVASTGAASGAVKKILNREDEKDN